MKKTILILTLINLLFSNLSFSQVPNYVPTNGLIGWWPFSGNANDLSGNGNNGIVNGATLVSNRFGINNDAYNFDGNDWIEVLNNASIQPSTAFSISVWAYIEPSQPSGSFARIISKQYNEPQNFGSYQIITGAINYYGGSGVTIRTGAGNSQTTAGIYEWSDSTSDNIVGQWQHIVGTYDGVNMRFYQNGNLKSSTIHNGNLFYDNGNLWFGKGISGASLPGNNLFFAGKIDDIGFWNRALTSCEISNLYNSQLNILPTISASGSTSFCQGGSVVLTSSSNSGNTWSTGSTSQSITVSNSGTYTVTASNGNCSSTSLPISVSVNQVPTVPAIFISGPTTFCQGGSVQLTSSSNSGNTWSNGSNSQSITVSNSGTYTVTASNGNCSATSLPLAVTVNSNPTVTMNSIGNFININENPIVLVGNPSGGSFSGNGVNGSVFNPQIAGLGISNINYNYTNSSGCNGNAAQSTIVYDTTGTICTTFDTIQVTINDTIFTTVTDTLIINTTLGLPAPNNENTILIYPNPASNYITIDNGNYNAMTGYNIKIENNAGQQVFQSAINQAQFFIDLSTWTGDGLYFVHLIDAQGNTVTIRKIVLQ